MNRLLATGMPFVIELHRPFVTDVPRLLQELGKRRLRTSSSSFQLPLKSKRLELSKYHRLVRMQLPADLEGSPLPYVFHDLLGNDDLREGLRRDRWRHEALEQWATRCPAPDFFFALAKRTPSVAARLAFGPAGTHSGLHRHGASVCELIFGTKRWNLHETAVTSRLKPVIEGLRVPSPQVFWWSHVVPAMETTRGDVRKVLRRTLTALAKRGLFDVKQLVHLERPLDASQAIGERFTQHAGTIVYLPPFWGHSTINDDWSLAFVQELKGDEATRAALRTAGPS